MPGRGRLGIPTPASNWIRNHARQLTHLPDRDEEPFRQRDLHDDLRDREVFNKAHRLCIFQKVGRFNDGDIDGHLWEVPDKYRERIEEVVEAHEKTPVDSNPVPCSCRKFAVRNLGTEMVDGESVTMIQCKTCGETFPRSEIDMGSGSEAMADGGSDDR